MQTVQKKKHVDVSIHDLINKQSLINVRQVMNTPEIESGGGRQLENAQRQP